MATSAVKSKTPTTKAEPNLLDRMGDSINRPRGHNKATAPAAKKMCAVTDAPPELIHRFDGPEQRASGGLFGLGKRRDRSHQLVQKQDTHGVWQVSVQAIHTGRVHPNQHAFSSSRRVTVEDFNNPNSALSKGARAATQRLNADANRLPDAPVAQPAKGSQPGQPSLSGAAWARQQAANAIAGVPSAVTGLAAEIGALPEQVGKLGATLARIPATLAAEATGGAVFARTRNPIRNDQFNRWQASPTVVQQVFARGQNELNKSLGADAQSLAYKAAAFAAPMLLGVKGGKAGRPGAPGTVQPPLNVASVRMSKAANGTVQLSKPNGATATMPEVAEAVAAGRLNAAHLRQAGFSPAKINGIMKRAGTLRDYWSGPNLPRASNATNSRPQSASVPGAGSKPTGPVSKPSHRGSVDRWFAELGNVANGELKPSSMHSAEQSNSAPQRSQSPVHPAPDHLHELAATLGIRPEAAAQVRSAYGGFNSGPTMVKYLRSISRPGLSEADAKTFVNAVRSAQNASTRIVKAKLAEALDHRDAAGNAQPTMTDQLLADIAVALKAQPEMDNDAARALLKAAWHPGFDNVGVGGPLIHNFASSYLGRLGYDYRHLLEKMPNAVMPADHRHANFTRADAAFARLVARAGLANTAPGPALGVVDRFSKLLHPSARVNAQFTGQPEVASKSAAHGHSVVSVAGQGLGQWGNLRMATAPFLWHEADALYRLQEMGIRTINLSSNYSFTGGGQFRQFVFEQYPDIKFVISAGNEGASADSLPLFNSVGSHLPNVTYVGNVNVSGTLAKTSNFGQAFLYAFGEKRSAASLSGFQNSLRAAINLEVSGTSLSAPDVANTYHKMDFLCPGLTPAESKAILTATVVHVPQRAGSAHGLASVPVVHHEDALTIASLEGLVRRQLRPVSQSVTLQAPLSGQVQSRREWTPASAQNPLTLNEAADILRLSTSERARLLPVAERLFPR